MKQYDLKDVVLKLVGNITPHAESYSDEEAIQNIKELKDLVCTLLDVMKDIVYDYSNTCAGSVQSICEEIIDFFIDIHKTMSDNVDNFKEIKDRYRKQEEEWLAKYNKEKEVK